MKVVVMPVINLDWSMLPASVICKRRKDVRLSDECDEEDGNDGDDEQLTEISVRYQLPSGTAKTTTPQDLMALASDTLSTLGHSVSHTSPTLSILLSTPIPSHTCGNWLTSFLYQSLTKIITLAHLFGQFRCSL